MVPGSLIAEAQQAALTPEDANLTAGTPDGSGVYRVLEYVRHPTWGSGHGERYTLLEDGRGSTVGLVDDRGDLNENDWGQMLDGQFDAPGESGMPNGPVDCGWRRKRFKHDAPPVSGRCRAGGIGTVCQST